MTKYYKEDRYDNGNLRYQAYFLNKEMTIYHNDNGPAYIYYYKNGNKYVENYILNNKLHNENSLAKIMYYENGEIQCKDYWLNNVLLENINSDEELKQYVVIDKYLELNNLS